MRHARGTARLLAAVLAMCVAGQALAQTGPGLLIVPFATGADADGRAELLGLQSGESGNPDPNGTGEAEFQLSVLDVIGRVRERSENYVPRFGFDYTLLNIDSDDPVLPDRLVDTAVAAGLALPDFEGFTGGFTIGLGYAGDGPFGDPQAFYGKATLVVGKKLDDRRDLGLVLDYDGNRSIMPDIPLPGFVYRHRIDKRLLLAAGVPITSVEWKPVDSVTLELIYALIDRFDVRATYDITRRVAIYGSFDQLREAFEMDELSRHDRLLYEQRRVEAGVRIRPMESTSLLVALGYAFSQEFGTGFDFSDTDPLAKPSDEPYLRLALETRF